MHDPITVAFEIKRPYPAGRRDEKAPLYWPPMVTIWHVDPEKDGTDDSCGWTRPNLTAKQLASMRWLGGQEAKHPWLLAETGKTITSAADAEALLRQAIFLVARVCKVRLSIDQASRLAAELLGSPTNNIRGSLCFLAGWHSNSVVDTENDRTYSATRLYCTLARNVLWEVRPWWRHPRWHIHHWRIQIHVAVGHYLARLAAATRKRLSEGRRA